MVGLSVGAQNTSYLTVNTSWGTGGQFSIFSLKSESGTKTWYSVAVDDLTAYKKNKRSFELGGGSSPTGDSGNNESHKNIQ